MWVISSKGQEFIIKVKERERDLKNNNKASITMTRAGHDWATELTWTMTNVHLEHSGESNTWKGCWTSGWRHCSWAIIWLVFGEEVVIQKKCILILIFIKYICSIYGSPGGSVGKESACNMEDLGSIPVSGRSPGDGNGNPLQYSCLENPMDRGAWWLQSMGSQRVRHKWVTKPMFN